MSATLLIITPIVLASAALVCAGCIKAIHPLLIRYALARPNARSSHRVPTPQGAGIAVISATLLVAGIAMSFLRVPVSPALWVLMGATVVMAVVGAGDDLRPLPVTPRLLLQATCIAITLSTVPASMQIVPEISLWVERAVLLLAALWFINLVNFMDGLDWITVAEVIPVTSMLVLIGMFADIPISTTLLAAALCGAMLGFAPFNRPVAKLFLGDVGSLPIGLLLAWCFLELAYAHHLTAAILLPLYYLMDATITLGRRLIRREPVWLAHRSHFYQRATDNGFAVIEIVGIVFFLNIELAVLAGLSVYFHSTLSDVIFMILGTLSVAYVLRTFAIQRG